jgi:uncharacterized membrane protein YdbT with pleckstrin-like domain
MSYVRHVLQQDEKIRYETTIHWIAYLPGFALLVLAGGVWLWSLKVNSMREFLAILVMLLLVLAAVALFSAWFRRWTTEIAVTNKRIIYKRGFIQRKTIEMNMDKVESVDVDQSILGRILDYGNVELKGTGSGFEPLRTIAAPLELRNHITGV